MRHTICIETVKTFYEISNLSKKDVESITSFFEDKVDNFFFSGIKYEMKDVTLFKIFSYRTEREYVDRINGSEELKAEGYFIGNKVYYKAESIEKLFSDVTNKFVRKLSTDRKKTDIIFYVNKARIDDLRIIKTTNSI